MDKIKRGLMVASTLAMVALSAFPVVGVAQNYAGTGNNGPLLASKVAGKLMLKADVGYVYNFASDWNKSGGANGGDHKSVGASAIGYGLSLGWTNKTGFGISGEYVGFTHRWTGTANGTQKYNFEATYDILTVTPNYRFSLDKNDNWGLRLGLGVGISYSDVYWGRVDPTTNGVSNGAVKSGTKVAGGTVFYNASGVAGTVTTAGNCTFIVNSPSATNGGAKKGQRYVGTGGQSFTAPSDDTYQPIIATPAQPNQINCYDSKGVYVDSITVTSGTAPVSGAVAMTEAASSGGGDSGAGGGAKDDAGVVLAPQLAIEYDNGFLHADLNVRYIHGLLNVRYFGNEDSSAVWNKSSGSITYTSKTGPLATFVGLGLGINF